MVDGASLTLMRAFSALPLVLTRRLMLDGDLPISEEALRNVGMVPAELVWGPHVLASCRFSGGRSWRLQEEAPCTF